MLTKKERLEGPEYLLTKYQNEIFRQLTEYMEKKKLKKKDVARILGVSPAYVSQVLNGDFNFTLKKLIELALFMEKVPCLEFVSADEFFHRNSSNYTEISALIADAKPIKFSSYSTGGSAYSHLDNFTISKKPGNVFVTMNELEHSLL